jgi:hypothetical protein
MGKKKQLTMPAMFLYQNEVLCGEHPKQYIFRRNTQFLFLHGN